LACNFYMHCLITYSLCRPSSGRPRPEHKWSRTATDTTSYCTVGILFYDSRGHILKLLRNKKAQLTLSNPRDVKACIAPIRRVSFHFTEFHFPKLPLHSFTWYVQSGSRPILLYTVWNPVFANYKVSCLNYKYLVYRLFS